MSNLEENGNEFTVVSENKTYTKSALIDRIVEEFKCDRELERIINSLQFEKSTLVLNPKKYPTLMEICAFTPDEVNLFVRDAVVELLRTYDVPPQRLEYVKSNFTCKFLFDEIIPLDRLTAVFENAIIQTIAQVVSIGKRESYVKEVKHKCQKCGTFETNRASELKCRCGSMMESVQTIFGDTVMAEIQQPYDEIIVQPTPYNIQFFDEDVFNLKIGDLKKIVLIRKSFVAKNKTNRKIILHSLSSTDVTQKTPKLPDDILKERFHKLSQEEDYISFLTKSIAPNVLFQDLAKLGCLLAVIGGTPTSGNRNLIHTLLCGDPSEAKTTILKFFTKLPFQKTGYAVGNQASGQGITVAMTKLGDGTVFPRAGLLTLCTGGYVALDELNLMKSEELDKIRECAEDGELSYNKGGFNLKLTANTTILAGLNPKWHMYDFTKSMKDNLNIPVPLLSRFDIKVNITSPQDITRERRIIEHIFTAKSGGVDKYVKDNNLLTSEELSLLINYARTFEPITTGEITKMLIEYYISQKSLEYNGDTEEKGLLRIDRRTGRSLVLLAEAFARLHFSTKVTEYHARLAIQFAKDCVKTFGFDPEKGLVQSTMRESTFTQKTAFENVCLQLEGSSEDKHFTEAEVTKKLLDEYPTLYKHDYQVHEMWKKFEEAGRFSYRNGRYKMV